MAEKKRFWLKRRVIWVEDSSGAGPASMFEIVEEFQRLRAALERAQDLITQWNNLPEGEGHELIGEAGELIGDALDGIGVGETK